MEAGCAAQGSPWPQGGEQGRGRLGVCPGDTLAAGRGRVQSPQACVWGPMRAEGTPKLTFRALTRLGAP